MALHKSMQLRLERGITYTIDSDKPFPAESSEAYRKAGDAGQKGDDTRVSHLKTPQWKAAFDAGNPGKDYMQFWNARGKLVRVQMVRTLKLIDIIRK